MSDITVSTGDLSQSRSSESFPVIIILDHLRSAHNVGNIFRLADVANIEKVICCGYTAVPPHPKLIKTAMGCDELVAYEHCDNTIDAIRQCQQKGYHVTAVETVAGAPDFWDKEFSFPVALVFGNEALGISEDALAACDSHIKMPVFGIKNSLNVGNCAAVILYKLLEILQSNSK